MSESESSGVDRIYLQIYDYETKEFSGLTTYHGLVRIYNSNTWPSRIFWCVVVLSCLTLFMIHSGLLLLGYHSKPTLFQVNTIVPAEGIAFPHITICNYNPVMMYKVKDYNMPSPVLSYLLKSYLNTIDEDAVLIEKQQNEYLAWKTNFESQNGSFSIQEFFQKTGPTCSDMIVSCIFGGVTVEDCCKDAEPVMTDFGQCIRIGNEQANRRQWFSGSPYGWQILIDQKNGERPASLPFEFADVGVKVHVHQQGKLPSMRANGVSIPPGNTLYAGIDVKNVTLLPRTDWGMCQPGWDEAKHGKRIVDMQYTSLHCLWNCELNEWMEKCGCYPIAHAVIHTHNICTPYDLQRCQKKEQAPLSCECEVECAQMQYGLQTSYGGLSRRGAEGRAGRQYAHTHVENNLSLMHIFMREMSYERHEQQKQLQTADLLSNIAGSMGLFLGMSTVTLLEIFIYLFKSVWGTINTERQSQFGQMLEEEEQEQLVIVEQPAPIIEEEEEEGESAPKSDFARKYSRRLSVAPVLSRRRSSRLSGLADITHSMLGAPRRSISVANHHFITGDRTGAVARRISNAGLFNMAHPPNLSGFRRGSVAVIEQPREGAEAGGRRMSLHPGPSTSRKMSVQPGGENVVHVTLGGRRRSSVTHLKRDNFLI